MSSRAPQDTPPCPPVPRSVCEHAENATRHRRIGATARSSARKVRVADGASRRGCVKRHQADVLLSKESGSPKDTNLERFALVGPRIKDLRDLFVIESGARSRSRTLFVLIACEVSALLDTARHPAGVRCVAPQAKQATAITPLRAACGETTFSNKAGWAQTSSHRRPPYLASEGGPIRRIPRASAGDRPLLQEHVACLARASRAGWSTPHRERISE